MLNYEASIEPILKLKSEVIKQPEIQLIHNSSSQILNSLKLDHKHICERECGNISKSLMKGLILKILQSNNGQLNTLFKQILQILYLKESPMLTIVYQSYPLLLRKYIENQDCKIPELDSVVKVIYFHESRKYNRYLKERQDFHKVPFVKDLYSIHFNKKTQIDLETQQSLMDKSISMDESQSSNSSSDKRTIKSIILSLIYRNLNLMSDQSLNQYFRMIYYYCGGDAKTYSKITSFYLLEKKNLFNLFKYSISEVEIQWMLLSLYQLSISSNKYKFELLAAINMIYKKTANQSLFKYSQIAQSIIHLLEDQYKDIFS